MANARTRFDTICEYLMRTREVRRGQLFGKPCLDFAGVPIIAFAWDGMAFRLKGRHRLQALGTPGAKFWDPMERAQPEFDWVLVPEAQFLRWDRFALDAIKLAEKGVNLRSTFGPRAEPAPDADARPELRSVRDVKPSGALSRLWSLVPIFGRH